MRCLECLTLLPHGMFYRGFGYNIFTGFHPRASFDAIPAMPTGLVGGANL